MHMYFSVRTFMFQNSKKIQSNRKPASTRVHILISIYVLQVLQKQMDLELELMAESGGKDKGFIPVAKVTVLQLSSTPVDQEPKTERDRDYSDDEDEFSSGEEEGADLSDSEPLRTKLPHARVTNLYEFFEHII